MVYHLGKEGEQVAGELQTELDYIGRWCDEAGTMVISSKASIAYFSLNNHITNTNCGSVFRDLGVQFDQSFAFTICLDQVVSKARKGIAAMRVIATANCV